MKRNGGRRLGRLVGGAGEGGGGSNVDGRRDTGRHEQASKCQGETNSWRRNLLREVCACLARRVCVHACAHAHACVRVHLYTAAYLFLPVL